MKAADTGTIEWQPHMVLDIRGRVIGQQAIDKKGVKWARKYDYEINGEKLTSPQWREWVRL